LNSLYDGPHISHRIMTDVSSHVTSLSVQ